MQDGRIYFKEDDKEKVIKFLNLVASKARFDLNTQEVIEYFKLLSYMQQELIPKIDSNMMGDIKITEAAPEESGSDSEES